MYGHGYRCRHRYRYRHGHRYRYRYIQTDEMICSTLKLLPHKRQLKVSSGQAKVFLVYI